MKKQTRYNHLVDVAFSVEGPWQNFEDIPLDELIAGLERRVNYLKANKYDAAEAFGDCDSAYEVD